jgi:hypothetical protein
VTVAIYSALYGGYDTVKPIDAGVPAYMFTDQPGLDAPGWTVIHRPHRIVSRNGPAELVGPMLAHKWWKTHPDEAISIATDAIWATGTFRSIWIDASITPEPGFVDKALAALGDDDWAMVPHPWRTCIYTEADYSASLARYAGLAGRILEQSAFYRNVMGHPADGGLIATGVNARRHSVAALGVSRLWWDECTYWTHQDQISLPVLLRLQQVSGVDGAPPLRWNTNIGWMEGWGLWPHLK